jgi:outer membrane protein
MNAMTRTSSIWMLSTMVSLAGMTAPAAAQQAPDSETHIRELIRLAAERVANGQIGAPTPGQANQSPSIQTASATGDTRPIVRLSLDEAVKLALDNNLDIAVQRLNPQINDIAIASIRAVYHPSLTSQVGTGTSANASTQTIAGNPAGFAIDTGTTTYNGGIAQSLPWGGGSLAVQLNNSRTTTTSGTATINPLYGPLWTGQYTQPIMRGLRIDSTRQQLGVTKITRDISDVQLRASIINTLSNVRNAYWDYVFAVQSVQVAQQSVALSQKLVEDNQTRVQVGTMAPLDVVQARSELATNQQALVTAQSTRRTNELALKRLIVGGTADANWGAAIDPTDRPDFRPEPVDVEAAVRRALSERTDITIVKKSIESNDVTLRYLKDQLLPQADLVGLYGASGLGGTFLQRGNNGGITGPVIGTVPGGYGDALSTLFKNNYPRWQVSMNFSYPLGLSTQQASVARARVQLSQVEAQVKQVELQVATEVTNAAITVQNTVEAVQAAQAARDLAQQKLTAEQSKFEVGMSTNYFVVQAQRDLATAQNSELQAMLNHRKAVVELERNQQTTLQSANITILSAAGAGGGTAPAGAAGTTAASATTTGTTTAGR